MKITNSNLKFGSYYQFNQTYANSNDVFEIEDEAFNMWRKGLDLDYNSVLASTFENSNIFAKNYVRCSDDLDLIIEAMFLEKGIDFKKTPTKVAQSVEGIISRVELSQDDKKNGRKLVFVKTDKFDEMFEKDMSYIEKSRKGFEFEPIEEHIKSGLPINASTVYLIEEKDGIHACFKDGRHRYCKMRNLGAKSIPISLDGNSLEIAKKEGIVDKIIQD